MGSEHVDDVFLNFNGETRIVLNWFFRRYDCPDALFIYFYLRFYGGESAAYIVRDTVTLRYIQSEWEYNETMPHT